MGSQVKRQTAVLMSATVGSPEQMKNTFLWGARLELLVLSAIFLYKKTIYHFITIHIFGIGYKCMWLRASGFISQPSIATLD